jgi:hypothetical protein
VFGLTGGLYRGLSGKRNKTTSCDILAYSRLNRWRGLITESEEYLRSYNSSVAGSIWATTISEKNTKCSQEKQRARNDERLHVSVP